MTKRRWYKQLIHFLTGRLTSLCILLLIQFKALPSGSDNQSKVSVHVKTLW